MDIMRSPRLAQVGLLCLLWVYAAAKKTTPPHIVMIVADDLGYNDLGARNARSHGLSALSALINL